MLRKLTFCFTLLAVFSCVPQFFVAAQESGILNYEAARDRDSIEDPFFGFDNAMRLTGDVQRRIDNDSFVLDIGLEEVIINHSTLDLEDQEIGFLDEAHRVTVYGNLNDDFFEERQLMASVIYVREGNRSILFK